MSRARISLLAFALVAGTGAMGARQEPQFRTGIHTVPIYATAVDRAGRLVTDLARDDFEVLDNGRPQPLTNFATGVQAITVVLMLDRSGSVEGQYRLVEAAAAEFVRHLTASDKARIGSFSLRIQIEPETFTSDRDTLLEILRARLQPLGPTPLWGAASAAMTALEGQPGRRVVLIFTDGEDAPLSDQPKVTFDDVKRRAETEEIMVYGIGLVDECAPVPATNSNDVTLMPRYQQGGTQGRGGQGGTGRGGTGRVRIRMPRIPVPLRLPVPPGRGLPPRTPLFPEPRMTAGGGCKPDTPDPSLKTLTDVGGGGFFELRQAVDLAATFARVADELHHQYLLAFVAAAHDGAFHKLDVRVRRPGVTIRARRGYIAPTGH